MKTRQSLPRFIRSVTSFLTAGSLVAQDATEAGRFHVEHPTLLNLGFEWSIRGDANRNAAVAVRFRAVGETTWRKALPLLRVGGERVYRHREHLDYTVPDGFAGSILNLQPGTEYECQFALTDPDGVTGQATQTVRVKTRTEPKPYEGGRVLHVYPPDYFGPRQEPGFTGILQAVNEDFVGKAPDLGAWESGQPPPHYGPRWLTWRPFYR